MSESEEMSIEKATKFETFVNNFCDRYPTPEIWEEEKKRFKQEVNINAENDIKLLKEKIQKIESSLIAFNSYFNN
jgi:hypothetical protein